MYVIVPQSTALENSKEKIYFVRSPADEKACIDAGYRRHERIYKVTYQHSDYAVHCPEYRDDEKGVEPVVFIPGFLVPGRRYPLEVYLYAIDIYSSNPEKGQRGAAEETRKRFGLATFAHTTLGRALKAFANKVDPAGSVGGQGTSGGAGGVRQSLGEGATPKKNAGFPTVQATWQMRGRAARFLRRAVPQPEGRAIAAAYREMAREWFREHRRFLL